jgi:hypothetical protein
MSKQTVYKEHGLKELCLRKLQTTVQTVDINMSLAEVLRLIFIVAKIRFTFREMDINIPCFEVEFNVIRRGVIIHI